MLYFLAITYALVLLLTASRAWVSSPRRIGNTARQEIAMSSSGWSSPDWNWGYAVGEAHNVAMTTRKKFDSSAERKAYLSAIGQQDVGTGLDVEELKMVLALRFQFASRQGKDGCGTGWNIMCEMAECKYEGSSVHLLREDLQVIADKLPAELTSSVELPAGVDTSTLGYVAACALAGTDFVRDGL